MAFTDMNDVEQELGEEKPPDRNGNRNFMIIAGILGGIMVLALLCIAGLALFRYLPGQRAAQNANATNEAQATAIALAASQTASAPLPTRTLPPTRPAPTNTQVPTNTPVIALGPTKTPVFDAPMATIYAMRTQNAQSSGTPVSPTSQPTSRPTTTALPPTGIAEELGAPGLITIAFVLVVIIFIMRRLRTAA
jgi:type II secretory pathway pseudopilin PulG